MKKQQKTKDELAELVLTEVRKIEGCEGIGRVGIIHITDDKVDYTWDVSSFNLGRSSRSDIQGALQQIVPVLQGKYDYKD